MRQRISRQRSLNSIFLKKAREITLVLFGILFIIIMLAYRLELAITTYLPLPIFQVRQIEEIKRRKNEQSAATTE